MELHDCPRCRNAFYTALYTTTIVRCPYCGFEGKTEGREKRKDVRARVGKDCVLTADRESIRAKVVDICERGIGVLATGDIPEGKTFRVVVEDFDLEASAIIVWKTRVGGGPARAGLRFI
ncbi:MAG: PilZ domain-containing protein [Candidatus Methylomirabilis sp.]|nr:PilZ domain-containing protein [Deltaproteobacteria bacterium]